MKGAKKTFGHLFLVVVIILMVLPFVTTFNELLTKIVENSLLYRPVEKYFVPYEVALIKTFISLFGVETLPNSVAVVKNGVNYGTFISWNCIGWQSFIILLISLKTGLQGRFTRSSVTQVILIGLLGTFFMNLFRISFVLILLYHFGKVPASIVHDYLGVLISIVWLFFFWWFSYNFILERQLTIHDEAIK